MTHSKSTLALLLALLLSSALPLRSSATGKSPSRAKDSVWQTQANQLVEISFLSKGNFHDPFNQVELDVLFTDPTGQVAKVPAFWDGGNRWKVRYSSPVKGVHRFKTVCSETGDKGLNGITGRIDVHAYQGENALLRHGALRISDDHRHFAYADGEPFFWLGDTWWMGLTKRLRWPDDVKELADDRSKKGFDVIQIVAGLYPDMPAFDDRGQNEAGFPWERDYSRIRPSYFDSADRRIMYLAERGFVPAIVGAWGYHLPWLGKEKMEKHWRYIIARWAALPVVWIAAGELEMPFYLSTTQDADRSRQKEEWTEVMRYMRNTDPFHRLITTHPSRTARNSVTDPSVLDFDMQQSGHGSPPAEHAAIALEGWNTQPVMPVISGESRYEALAIPIPLPASAPRQAFWAHVMNAGFTGQTYGANGVWQVNGKEHPYGASPGGNNWGTTPWSEAMKLPGSAQLGAAKTLILSLPGWNFLAPHPGEVFTDSPRIAPLCAATGNGLRVIYMLAPGTIRLDSLRANDNYTAAWFNPVSGETGTHFTFSADSSGSSTLSSPAEEQDWVLTVQGRQ